MDMCPDIACATLITVAAERYGSAWILALLCCAYDTCCFKSFSTFHANFVDSRVFFVSGFGLDRRLLLWRPCLFFLSCLLFSSSSTSSQLAKHDAAAGAQ
jgi:hypothetical protein